MGRYNLTPEQVIAIRDDWRQCRGHMRLQDFAKKYGYKSHGNLSDLLYGQTYKHVPGICTREEQLVYRNPLKRTFTQEVVLFMRLQYNPPKVTLMQLAAYYKIKPSAMCRILLGQFYREVPAALTGTEIKGTYVRRAFTNEQALSMRRRYRSGHISANELAVETGVRRSAILQMLRGLTYKAVPEAVPYHVKKRRLKPWWSEERKAKRRERIRSESRKRYLRNKHDPEWKAKRKVWDKRHRTRIKKRKLGIISKES